jgi:hypothetical protein
MPTPIALGVARARNQHEARELRREARYGYRDVAVTVGSKESPTQRWDAIHRKPERPASGFGPVS